MAPPILSQHAGLVAFDCEEELQGHIAACRRNRALPSPSGSNEREKLLSFSPTANLTCSPFLLHS
ncbi:class I/II aminotransferase [Sphingomonas sp. MM-1]|nr:class I/II aminotransferase [Sphingomonas sp. MM-1]